MNMFTRHVYSKPDIPKLVRAARELFIDITNYWSTIKSDINLDLVWIDHFGDVIIHLVQVMTLSTLF